MEGTTSRIDVTSLSQESQELQLVPEESATDFHLLASKDANFVASQEGLGNDGAQTAHKMLSGIDNNRLCIRKKI